MLHKALYTMRHLLKARLYAGFFIERTVYSGIEMAGLGGRIAQAVQHFVIVLRLMECLIDPCKFANGALSAAFEFSYNYLLHYMTVKNGTWTANTYNSDDGTTTQRVVYQQPDYSKWSTWWNEITQLPGISLINCAFNECSGHQWGEAAASLITIRGEAPVGRIGAPMEVPRGTNAPATIDGIDYSGHALDQMQGRGLVPSVVRNTLETGTTYPTRGGTTGFYDPANNLRVIINSETGKVVTTIPGKP